METRRFVLSLALPTSNTNITYFVDILNPELINLALGIISFRATQAFSYASYIRLPAESRVLPSKGETYNYTEYMEETRHDVQSCRARRAGSFVHFDF